MGERQLSQNFSSETSSCNSSGCEIESFHDLLREKQSRNEAQSLIAYFHDDLVNSSNYFLLYTDSLYESIITCRKDPTSIALYTFVSDD
jgi:hypothetical protein